jgi:hypothetical protein
MAPPRARMRVSRKSYLPCLCALGAYPFSLIAFNRPRSERTAKSPCCGRPHACEDSKSLGRATDLSSPVSPA